ITGPTGPGPTVSLKFLYVANFNENTVEIYDIFNPIFPVRIGEFNGGNLANPAGLAITGTTLYVTNNGDDTVEIYNLSNPTAPIRIGEFNGGDLSEPLFM
ncbi:collagen-like triple helix repeat-containing protein, partial [Bacillus mycoides]